MKSVITFAIAFTISMFATGPAFAHGPVGDESTGSPMMLRMMELMHGNIDRNKAINCAGLTDAELIEKGEEMMEQMLGKEVHGKIEEEMEKISMKAHDDMHTMMGMGATGCVGDETMNTLVGRQGLSQRLEELERRVQSRAGWPMVIGGITLGVIVGWVASHLTVRKPFTGGGV